MIPLTSGSGREYDDPGWQPYYKYYAGITAAGAATAAAVARETFRSRHRRHMMYTGNRYIPY